MDNGPEYARCVFMECSSSIGICQILIQPERSMQNRYIESFDSKFKVSA